MKKLGLITTLLLLGSAALAATPKDTLVIQESADIPTFDPAIAYDTASGEFIENIYEGLWTYKGASLRELEPVLASAMPKYTNSGKTLVVNLRKGVKFQSGNAFTCADVEYTYRRDLVTNNPASGNWYLAGGLLGTESNAKDDPSVTWAKISGAVKCDAQGNVVFTLPKPDPAFMAKLASSNMTIVDGKYAASIGEWNGTEATWKEWIGKDVTGGPLDKKPSGTGAYQVISRDANSVLLKAFAGYWGKKPAIQNVIWQKVPELAARQQAFLKGDADIIETGSRANVEQQLKGKPGVVVVDNLPNVYSTGIFMQQKITDPTVLGSGKLDGKGIPATFFSDVNVRRAMAYSFDYAGYIRDVQQGKGKQRTMLLPDSFPGYAPKVKTYTYDPVQATAYFKRAYSGNVWRNGFVINANYRAGAVASQTAMEILKKNVEALNPKFKINIAAKQWSTMLTDGKNGKEPMILQAWAPDYADADNFLYTFYSSKGYYFPNSSWKDASVDKWLDQARTIVDPAARNRLYAQVAQRAYEQSPYVLIPGGINLTVVRDNLKGATAANFNPMLSFSYTGTFWKELSKD